MSGGKKENCLWRYIVLAGRKRKSSFEKLITSINFIERVARVCYDLKSEMEFYMKYILRIVMSAVFGRFKEILGILGKL